MIAIENVTKSYGKTNEKLVALNNVSATIHAGELVGIIGFSGAGKSTLIRQLSLIEKADCGSIFLEDVDLFKLKGKDLLTMRRQLGIVFQGYQLLQQKNVFDNIAFPLQLTHTPKEKIKQKVKDLIQLVGLQDKSKVYPSQLSGGQKQRVAIARALASDPKLLLLDEPTSALDGVTTQSILDLLRKIHEKTHVTILIITHELPVVKSVCDRVIVMDQGQFIESGKVETVFKNPNHPTTKLILSHHMGIL